MADSLQTKTNQSIINEPQRPGRNATCLSCPPSAASGLVNPPQPVNVIKKWIVEGQHACLRGTDTLAESG